MNLHVFAESKDAYDCSVLSLWITFLNSMLWVNPCLEPKTVRAIRHLADPLYTWCTFYNLCLFCAAFHLTPNVDPCFEGLDFSVTLIYSFSIRIFVVCIDSESKYYIIQRGSRFTLVHLCNIYDYFNTACDLSHCAKNVFALCHYKILLYIF